VANGEQTQNPRAWRLQCISYGTESGEVEQIIQVQVEKEKKLKG